MSVKENNEIDWSKAKVSRKPCPRCGVDIFEYNDMKQRLAKLEKLVSKWEQRYE